jgi:trehalose synthase
VQDPHDLREFGTAVSALLGDADRRQRLGARARQRVLDRFLPDRHLLQYLALFGQLLGTAEP